MCVYVCESDGETAAESLHTILEKSSKTNIHTYNIKPDSVTWEGAGKKRWNRESVNWNWEDYADVWYEHI